MAESLYKFMNALNKNNVRTQNLFEMKVFIPQNLRNATGDNGHILTDFFNPNMTFYGQNFSLPGRTINSVPVGFKGFTVPVPTTMSMDQQHTVTMNADINGDLRRAFLAWQACTMNPQIDKNGGYFEGNRHLDNTSKIYIALIDPTFEDSHSVQDIYEIDGVFISNVGAMNFSNTESGLATFDVQFTSQYWQVLNTKRATDDGSVVLTDWTNRLKADSGNGQRRFTNVF